MCGDAGGGVDADWDGVPVDDVHEDAEYHVGGRGEPEGGGGGAGFCGEGDREHALSGGEDGESGEGV